MDYSLKLSKDSGSEFLYKYYLLCNTYTDIKIAARCSMSKKSAEFMDEAISAHLSLDRRGLIAAASEGFEHLRAYLEQKGYEAASEALGISFSAYEKYSDRKAAALMDDAKNIYLGIEPLWAYMNKLEREELNLRLIINAHKNGIDESILKERLR